jgi:uncharacterized protein YodC (DUF2158 family)
VEIVYALRSLVEGGPSITITDAAGKTVGTLGGERLPGLYRLHWDMRQKPEEGAFVRREQKFVQPGVYTVTLTLGKEKQTQKVTISGLPELSEISSESGASERDTTDRDEIGQQ